MVGFLENFDKKNGKSRYLEIQGELGEGMVISRCTTTAPTGFKPVSDPFEHFLPSKSRVFVEKFQNRFYIDQILRKSLISNNGKSQHLKNDEKMLKKSKKSIFVFCLYLIPMMSESCFSMFRHAKSDFYTVYCDGL